jgi:phosphatidylglycerol---prolipoprotein diacylglyceryl transferase
MQFPLYIGPIHPHFLFESLGYAVAFRLCLRNVRRGDGIGVSARSSVMVGGLLGALLGSKLLVVAEHFGELGSLQAGLVLFLQGKTVVGGLLGAIVGVEIVKKWIGVKVSTGDVFVYPLIFGTMIGRVGCFLTGLEDRTYGTVTNLPWGVDFGDGLLRHPTQLYEIFFLLFWFLFLRWRSGFGLRSGELFRFYVVGYLGFRLFVDFLKPGASFSAIQVACVVGILCYWRSLVGLLVYGGEDGRPPKSPNSGGL